MLKVSPEGIISDGRIIVRRYLNLEHGPLSSVVALVLHQTDSSTAQQTFNSYAKSPHGAHFLIDKNGQVYQTASLANMWDGIFAPDVWKSTSLHAIAWQWLESKQCLGPIMSER